MDHLDSVIHANLSAMSWQIEAVVRLLLAGLAGGLVGLEREVRGRQAGFRTNLLVAVGSALVMIVSSRMVDYDWPTRKDITITVDPSRIAYGVMTGIGFLGAGIIMKTQAGVRGLTTAAALWCVAAIGLAAGQGLYSLSFCASVIVLLSLWLLDHLEDILPKKHHRTIKLRCPWTPGCISAAIKHVEETGVHVRGHGFERTADLRHVNVELRLALSSRQDVDKLEHRLSADGIFQLLSLSEG